jgi:hypothetical protein
MCRVAPALAHKIKDNKDHTSSSSSSSSYISKTRYRKTTKQIIYTEKGLTKMPSGRSQCRVMIVTKKLPLPSSLVDRGVLSPFDSTIVQTVVRIQQSLQFQNDFFIEEFRLKLSTSSFRYEFWPKLSTSSFRYRVLPVSSWKCPSMLLLFLLLLLLLLLLPSNYGSTRLAISTISTQYVEAPLTPIPSAAQLELVINITQALGIVESKHFNS